MLRARQRARHAQLSNNVTSGIVRPLPLASHPPAAHALGADLAPARARGLLRMDRETRYE
jgi:hypothetical protein